MPDWCHFVLLSVLWRCWLGGRKGIRPVKKQSGGVLAWLSVWSNVQTCIWPNWCHCHSLSLASVKSRSVLPFWCWLTWVVPEKGPLNGCVCVMSLSWRRMKVFCWHGYIAYWFCNAEYLPDCGNCWWIVGGGVRCLLNGWLWSPLSIAFLPTKVMCGAMVRISLSLFVIVL